MLNDARISKLLRSEPFSIERTKAGFFGSSVYKVKYNNEFYGTVNNKELASELKTLLNGGYLCGAGSGIAYGESLDKISPSDLKPGYDAYTLEVYKGNDPDYEFTITFEDSPIRNFGGISLPALKNSINALNQAHALGFKHGVTLAREIRLENEATSPSPSM